MLASCSDVFKITTPFVANSFTYASVFIFSSACLLIQQYFYLTQCLFHCYPRYVYSLHSAFYFRSTVCEISLSLYVISFIFHSFSISFLAFTCHLLDLVFNCIHYLSSVAISAHKTKTCSITLNYEETLTQPSQYISCHWISFKTSLKEWIINQDNCETGTATEDAFTKGQYFLQHIYISFNINSNPRLSRLIVEVEKSLRKLPCSTTSLTFTNYFNDDRRFIFVLSFLNCSQKPWLFLLSVNFLRSLIHLFDSRLPLLTIVLFLPVARRFRLSLFERVWEGIIM